MSSFFDHHQYSVLCCGINKPFSEQGFPAQLLLPHSDGTSAFLWHTSHRSVLWLNMEKVERKVAQWFIAAFAPRSQSDNSSSINSSHTHSHGSLRGFLRLREPEQLPLHASADRLASGSKQQHIKRSFDAQYGYTEGQVRERVAPCRQRGFWEILPAFRAGYIYSLLVEGDGCRAWERALFGMKKCILAVVRVAMCSGCSMVWVGPYGTLFMSII